MKCIIVDDEPYSRKRIQKMIQKLPLFSVSGQFGDAKSALEFLNGNTVDLIFLDIEMPGMTGIEFAKALPEKTMIIFTTAFSEYALESYELEAVDYLLKPINEERLIKAVNKAQEYHKLLQGEQQFEKADASHLFIRADRRTHRINYDDLLFIEGLKDYVILQLKNQKLITNLTIKNIHGLLPKNRFLRVNRSYIVNKDHIDSFDSSTIFIGEYEIPLGSTYRTSFMEGFM